MAVTVIAAATATRRESRTVYAVHAPSPWAGGASRRAQHGRSGARATAPTLSPRQRGGPLPSPVLRGGAEKAFCRPESSSPPLGVRSGLGSEDGCEAASFLADVPAGL